MRTRKHSGVLPRKYPFTRAYSGTLFMSSRRWARSGSFVVVGGCGGGGGGVTSSSIASSSTHTSCRIADDDDDEDDEEDDDEDEDVDDDEDDDEDDADAIAGPDCFFFIIDSFAFFSRFGSCFTHFTHMYLQPVSKPL